MFRLIKLLSSYRNTLLFVFLEFVAFLFIIRYNQPQRRLVGDAMLEISGRVQQQQNRVWAYLDLPEQNERLLEINRELQEENDQLIQRLAAINNQRILDSIRPYSFDSIVSAEDIAYIPCLAIRNTLDKSYNHIVIDKGTRHGIYEGMGLVSPSGVAGRVVQTSENFSLALSALNVSFKLSALVNGVTGLYEWEEGDPQHGFLGALPMDAREQVRTGDTVVASGSSTIFPRGYIIGYVESTENLSQDSFYRIRIRLATDFSRLHSLFAINMQHRGTIDSLVSSNPLSQ